MTGALLAIAEMTSGDLIWSLHVDKDGEEEEGIQGTILNLGLLENEGIDIGKACKVTVVNETHVQGLKRHKKKVFCVEASLLVD
jgi:hypothetical protein